jgi:hypothetical protein
LQDANSILIAYYYFNYNDTSKHDLRGLLSSLLMQLCEDHLPSWDVLYKLYTACRDGLEQPTEIALAGCLEGMLELPEQVPIYIIVDALDECPHTTGSPSHRQTVLEFVRDLVGRSHSSLHICITSRLEQDIQATLRPLTSESRRVSLQKEHGQREDINSYIHSFVQTNDSMQGWSAQDKEVVIDTLMKNAGGT